MFVKNIYTKNVFIKFEPFFDFFSQPNLALLFKNSLYCLVYMLDVVLFIIITLMFEAKIAAAPSIIFL